MRIHLIESLAGLNAHLPFERAVERIPPALINERVNGIPYSCWELVEHMRLAQHDILDFMRNPGYQEPDWPDDYWPRHPGDPSRWEAAINEFLSDRKALESMVKDESVNLFAPIPHAPDYTIFREITLMANHNSYHTGQLVILGRALKVWE